MKNNWLYFYYDYYLCGGTISSGFFLRNINPIFINGIKSNMSDKCAIHGIRGILLNGKESAPAQNKIPDHSGIERVRNS